MLCRLIKANGISKEYVFRAFDLTGSSQFTLTTKTREVLTELDQEVDVLFFATPSDPTGIKALTEVLLAQYRNVTDKLDVERIDPETDPETFRLYFEPYLNAGIPVQYLYPSLMFQTPRGIRLVAPAEIYSDAEHAFTSAILEVTGTVQKRVYFLTGHGEADPTGADAPGYSLASSSLQDNLFKVETLDLLATPAIPEDLAVLVIAGPKRPLVESEKQIIADYLTANGSVFFLLDPDSPPEFASLLAPWGLEMKTGTVVEPKSYSAPNKNTPLVDRTRNQMGATSLYFPGAAAISPLAQQPVQVQGGALVWATADSWLEKDPATASDPTFDEGVDEKGEQWIMGVLLGPAVVEGTEESDNPQMYEAPNIAVLGDSDFAANRNFQNVDNGSLFVNLVNNLAASKELITMERKVLPIRPLVMSPEEERFLNISSVILLPLVVLIIGGAIWWRRRK